VRRTPYIAFIVLSGFVGGWLGYYLGVRANLDDHTGWPWASLSGYGPLVPAAGLSLLFLAISTGLVFYLPGRRIRRAIENGTPARAEILAIETTGERSVTPSGVFHQVRCELEVRPRGADTYRAKVTQFLSEEYEKRLHPGSTIQVRYIPARPNDVAIVEPQERAT
jgi:hypothetical protein